MSEILSPARHDGAGVFIEPRNVDSWRVRAQKDVAYEVRFCEDVFDPRSTALLETGVPDSPRSLRRFVVIDSVIDNLHGERIRAWFDHHRVEAHLLVLEIDETVKTLDMLAQVAAEFDAFGIDRRREPIIVIGGGVIMDIVGLAANLYRRGTPFVRVPTTLIGLVDAGVGVKTGVNFNGHKNRLGTYFEKSLTLLDPSFLRTLDERHISNGMAEILKIAIVKDRDLFDVLSLSGPELIDRRFQNEDRSGRRAAAYVLEHAIHGMLKELQPNLWEADLERVVDYGHTFSPTVEMHALPALLHGEAVCIDMALTTVMAARRGLMTDSEMRLVLDVMRALRLPAWDDCLEPELLARALEDTRRHRDGQQRLPLPVGIGACTFVNDVTTDEITAALHQLRSLVSDGAPQESRA
ncbi:sedoheptulose 7-phosphate cyclase [Xylanimonas protaetiae]|uniref:sedoheptulose 7-phosphate cyclase n=1 Tax=Xylanimonas protaetiae TaxID=2509457 RepID=UPI001A90E49D|nr:sedoheptulose 7-phosphate cyclase [Xylanimonas protaetiae]